MNSRIIYLIAIFVCINGYAHAAFPRYRVTDMRPMMPYGGEVNALNNHGDMVGKKFSPQRMQLWRGNSYTLINPPVQSPGVAPSIYNDSGVVGGATGYYGALWSEASGWELLPRDGWMGGGVGDTWWRVAKYDESLQIVAGYNEVNVGSNQTSSQACRWEKVNGTWTKIMSPVVNGMAMWFAEDMDPQGNIVGHGQVGSQYGRTLMWNREQNSLTALSVPSAEWTTASDYGFGANGEVFGAIARGGGTGPLGAFLYYSNPTAVPEVTYYPEILGHAKTNIHGWIASSVGVSSSGESVLWSRENGFSKIKDLLEPGSPSMRCGRIIDLNDNGSMVLIGHYTSGAGSWFYARLDPVPEPTSLLLLAPGLAWMVIRRRRNQSKA